MPEKNAISHVREPREKAAAAAAGRGKGNVLSRRRINLYSFGTRELFCGNAHARKPDKYLSLSLLLAKAERNFLPLDFLFSLASSSPSSSATAVNELLLSLVNFRAPRASKWRSRARVTECAPTSSRSLFLHSLYYSFIFSKVCLYSYT